MLLLRALIILSTSFESTKEKLKEGCPLNKDRILIMPGLVLILAQCLLSKQDLKKSGRESLDKMLSS